MTNKWHSLKPSQLLPAGVTDLADVFSTLTSTLTTVLETSQATLEAARATSTAASSDALEQTLQTLLSELKAFIDGLASNTTAHSIFIPIQKQPFGLGVEPAEEIIPAEDRTPSYDSVAEANGIDEDSDHPEFLVNFINNAATAVGGNRGVWKQLQLSLRDIGDESRPEFPDNYAVAGTAILFGAENVRGVMKQAQLFQSMLKHHPRADLTSKVQPVPENIRTRVVPDPLSGEIGIIVEWDPVTPLQNPSLFSNEALLIDEIFVIRSTDPSFREKFTWSEVFSSQPKPGDTLQVEVNARVIARLRNDGFIRKYIDRVALEKDVTYYYALACSYTLDDERQPIGDISKVSRVNYTGRPVASRRSEAPDWLSTPSLVDLFPALQSYLNKATLAIEGLTQRTLSAGGPAGALDQALTQLESEVSRIESINQELTEITSRLRQHLSEDPGGIYTTQIVVDDGGIETWVATLARVLSDPDDTSRPPFDGSELVGGVFILAGAPTPAGLTGFKTLLDLFLGAPSDNPLLTALSSVETVVAETEASTFDAALRPVPTETVAAPAIAPSVVFTSDMTPSPTTSCE